ncbi:efflux RND transporter permease subunit [Methylophaga sp.]|uniref:efflux RND transporter permease subunit n=1 Tax=Methylophaga sp. TaxID=2024840 RepID=UPI003F69B1C5
MLNRIIDAAVTHRLLVVALLLLTALVAMRMIPRLNLDAFPDVSNVQVAINTEAPGLAAEEVEQLISFPIEAVMYALPDVEEVRSISKTGLSGITVVFKEGTDIYFARQLVFERLQAAQKLIPEGVGTPQMGPNTSGLGQIYQYLLVADTDTHIDKMALRSLNDWLVKLMLMPVDGVTDVLSFGGEVRQYQVNLDPSRLLSYQLTQHQVMTALENNNNNAGGWYLNRGQEQLVIRGTGWFSHGREGLRELRQMPLKTIKGTVITLDDVAEVKLGSEIRQGAVTMSQRQQDGTVQDLGEVVAGIVLKRIGANTKATIEGVKKQVELINQALPEGVRLTSFYDQTDLIEKAVNTVVKALFIAFILIVVILAFFLMNLSATLLVLLSIPVSIAIALMLMSWLGMSANLMSLGGIAVAIGMLVDGSVVMVENILKHIERGSHSSIGLMVKEASQEVARPIFFAVAIILAVFLPLFSFEGVEAKLFEPMAASIMLAVVAAVFVAIVVVPALASLLLKAQSRQRTNYLVNGLERLYQFCLTHALRAKGLVVAVALILLTVAAITASRLGTEFVPQLEEGTLNLRVTLAPSASLDTTLSVAPQLQKMLMDFPEVIYALSRIGRPELGGDPEPVNNIEIYIGLKPENTWTSANSREQLQALMTEKLSQFPGLLFNFSQPIATRVDELLSGVKSQLAIKLFGPDLSILAEKGKTIENAVKQVDGATDVAMEQITGEAQLIIKPDRRQLSRYGLSVKEVMNLVNDGIGGGSAGQIINGNERYDIYVRLAQRYRNNAKAIADLRLLSADGAWIRLGDVAEVSIESGPPQIRRDDVQRRVVVQANVENRAMGNVVADIQQTINQNVNLPAGYVVDIGGQFESQQRAQKRLILVVPLSLLLIAVLLYFAFGSAGQAMLILVNIPLAVIGGVFALYFSGQYLSVPGSVGFITLFGVAVLNGVVLVENINQRIDGGVDEAQAVFEGAVSRLRPVLMTALTSALGLVPMLLSEGVGAEIQKPLATVIVGGLLTATLLTLFVLPVLYSRFSAKRQ